MQTARAQTVTALLHACAHGERDAMEQLVPLVYDELRVLAAGQIRREQPGHTLQPTALAHEAFVKLVGESDRVWENRRHFFNAAAKAMRRILVNHAHARRAAKRGGNWRKVPLDDVVDTFESRAVDLIALDEALARLAAMDVQKSQIVELRFFAGLTADETAKVMDVTTRTIERHWRTAKSWLRTQIGEV